MYSIRQATERDLAVLPEIEDAAGTLFLDTSYAALASQPNTSANIDPARDHVWVIAHGHVPVGFLMARDIAGAVHVQELHIHPRFAHRRLGAQLIEHVAHWARAKNSPALTLTTFADVPWNAPYYSRLGFTMIGADEMPFALSEILRAEAAAGFPMRHRVAMRMSLSAPLALGTAAATQSG